MRMLLIYVSTFTIFMLAAWVVDRAFRTEATVPPCSMEQPR